MNIYIFKIIFMILELIAIFALYKSLYIPMFGAMLAMIILLTALVIEIYETIHPNN